MSNSTTSGQLLIADIRLAGAARISRTVCNAIPDDLTVLPNDPQATALRNDWAADVVIYITCGGPPLLGQAYLPRYGAPQPGSKFAPVAYASLLSGHAINPGDFIAAHECAHAFGANHNPDQVPTNPTRPSVGIRSLGASAGAGLWRCAQARANQSPILNCREQRTSREGNRHRIVVAFGDGYDTTHAR